MMDKKIAAQLAAQLVNQMTVEEKASQLLFTSPAIERLGIHEYNWWNEACHGVARAGTATVFPQTIAQAATFHPELVEQVADAISTEARAKYNMSIAFGDRDIYKGLTYFAPNINIFRDPRWGRGQETCGEDPFLTATLGCAYIRGLQGNGEYLKAAACAKHFAVHSGPEKLRHQFDAVVDDHDLYETYLPAFEWAVKQAGVAGVMGAYNRTNGEPCSASRRLILDILRQQWQFDGYFVSDAGAITNICQDHHYTETMAQAAALALKNGCNLNLGNAYEHLMEAFDQGLISDDDLTQAAVQVFTIRFLLGEFDNPRPYADIPYTIVDCPEHRALNLKAAQESMVLLENRNRFLPVEKKQFRRIGVVGPNAMSLNVLEGNYNGKASEYITVADGLRQTFPDAEVRVTYGSAVVHKILHDPEHSPNLYSDGAAVASVSDLTVLCLGYDPTVEGEEMDVDFDCFDRGDRRSLTLPQTQLTLAKAVLDHCENVVIVVMSGCCIDIGVELRSRAKAVIQAWYPGAVGGLAVAQLIAGDFSPSGKLPITFYRSDNTLPDFADYRMEGRTYRFMTEEPLYPFGYGLSYSETICENLRLASEGDSHYTLALEVRNTGSYPVTEKLQIYASFTDSRTPTPLRQLCGIKAVTLQPGETKTEALTVDKYWLKAVDENGQRMAPNGGITLYVGTHQPDSRSNALCGNRCLELKL